MSWRLMLSLLLIQYARKIKEGRTNCWPNTWGGTLVLLFFLKFWTVYIIKPRYEIAKRDTLEWREFFCPIKNTKEQGWKPGYLASWCQFQFRCVETQMSGFSLGLVSRLLKNRFQFRFQFCLRTTSVSGFQFRFKFHSKKLFYFEYGLCRCSIF